MRNKMIDLHNHLFCQLERLSDEDLKGDKLEEELKRSDAISKISQNIIKNADVCLKAERLKYDGLIKETPAMLENKNA
ncbi:MAG: hypothetical protein JJU10_05630 [Idiomarina sp.]|nr:hypothetical protein [Idiomarina sp.]